MIKKEKITTTLQWWSTYQTRLCAIGCAITEGFDRQAPVASAIFRKHVLEP
jgi:hypothetical protein